MKPIRKTPEITADSIPPWEEIKYENNIIITRNGVTERLGFKPTDFEDHKNVTAREIMAVINAPLAGEKKNR